MKPLTEHTGINEAETAFADSEIDTIRLFNQYILQMTYCEHMILFLDM